MARILQLPKSQKFRAEGIPAEGIPHESAGEAFGISRARAFVRGHGLRVLERTAGLEIGRDPRRAKRMAADPDPRAEIRGAALDHAPGVDTVHRLFPSARRCGR